MVPLTLIVKPVGNRCPLECTYCYTEDPNLCFHHSFSTMDYSLVEKLFIQYLSLDQKQYSIIWHGGEPTLAGIEFYENVLDIERSVLKTLQKSTRIDHKIQTNAVLLNNAWAEFFNRAGFKPGISIDGPEDIHNAHRVYKNKRGSFKDVMRGISCLEQEGIRFGVGAVITKTSIQKPTELFDFFVSRFPDFDMSPCFETVNPDNTKTYAISSEEYANFVIKVFDMWWELDDPKVKPTILQDMVKNIIRRKPKSCDIRKGGCEGYMGIDSDGGVYPCGRLMGISELRLGFIQEKGFEELRAQPSYLRFLEHMNKLSTECRGCKWVDICNNGCTAIRYLKNGEYLEKYPLCDGYKKVLDHIDSRIAETVSSST